MTDNSSEDRLALEIARMQLAITWFAGAGALFVLLIAQSFGTVYKGELQEVWSAFLPMILPTLSLMISVLGAAAIESGNETRSTSSAATQITVKRSFFTITRWLSIVYLVLIFVSIIGQPAYVYFQSSDSASVSEALGIFSTADGSDPGSISKQARPIDLLKVSNLWLAPIQGLVVPAMGILFFSKR